MIERICMRSMNRLFAVFAAIALLSPAAVFAAAPATVEAVQAPAWRDRGGLTVPLAAGMELKSGDVVRTGAGSRAYLMLAEGSRVKLGEGAQFTLYTASLRPEKTFRGALDIVAGAFRFTTAKLKKTLPREVAIRVGTATIGIRGTDIWGKTDKDGDLVALIDGRIEIARAGEITELAKPMTFFDAPAGKAAEVKPLDMETFVKLARQTEILPGDGAARAKGKGSMRLATVASEEAALELYDRIREAGFAARILPRATEGGGWTYELRLGGYANAAEAEAAASVVQTRTGLRPVVGP
jgi:hypothetical protein